MPITATGNQGNWPFSSIALIGENFHLFYSISRKVILWKGMLIRKRGRLRNCLYETKQKPLFQMRIIKVLRIFFDSVEFFLWIKKVSCVYTIET